MAWQKTKILLISVETDENGKKIATRYVKNKSKGKGKPQQGKLVLKKYNKALNKHTTFTESKYK